MSIEIRDQIERRAIGSLVPYARNSRTHSEEQVAQIAASMRQWGWTTPVLVDEDGGIIAGHGRVMAAQSLGLSEVPVITASGWSDDQKRAYVIADNKLALNAGWDDNVLASELAALRGTGFEMDLLGFSADELGGFFPDVPDAGPDPDEAPAAPATPVSRAGDTWLLGAHRVRCGSSTDAADWVALMGGERADVVWTDPPYNVAYESALAGSIQNDSMPDAQFRQFLVDAFGCLISIMKPGAAIYVAHADIEGYNFRSAFIGAGLKLSGCLIWRKDSLVLGRSDFQWQHEPILYGWRPGSAHRWYGGRKQTTVLNWGEVDPIVKREDGRYQIAVADRILIVDGEATIEEVIPSVINEPKPSRSSDHPTMKPVSLIERQLKNSARSGDLVVDAFGGSGSTLIAADRLGMSARLMELDPRFVDVIVRRWQDFTGRSAVLYTTGALWSEVAADRGVTEAA